MKIFAFFYCLCVLSGITSDGLIRFLDILLHSPSFSFQIQILSNETDKHLGNGVLINSHTIYTVESVWERIQQEKSPHFVIKHQKRSIIEKKNCKFVKCLAVEGSPIGKIIFNPPISTKIKRAKMIANIKKQRRNIHNGFINIPNSNIIFALFGMKERYDIGHPSEYSISVAKKEKKKYSEQIFAFVQDKRVTALLTSEDDDKLIFTKIWKRMKFDEESTTSEPEPVRPIKNEDPRKTVSFTSAEPEMID